MNVKLTLNIDQDLVDQAKMYARKKNESLSSLVQNYFKFLSEKNHLEDMEISPNVKALTGIIQLEKNFDLKNEYGAYILEKYS